MIPTSFVSSVRFASSAKRKLEDTNLGGNKSQNDSLTLSKQDMEKSAIKRPSTPHPLTGKTLSDKGQIQANKRQYFDANV